MRVGTGSTRARWAGTSGSTWDKKAETHEYRRAQAQGRPAERPERDAKRGPGRSVERAPVAAARAGRGATAGPGDVERLGQRLGRAEAAIRALGSAGRTPSAR